MPIRIGDTELKDIQVGNTPVKEVRLGNTLVWQRLAPPEIQWQTSAGVRSSLGVIRLRRGLVNYQSTRTIVFNPDNAQGTNLRITALTLRITGRDTSTYSWTATTFILRGRSDGVRDGTIWRGSITYSYDYEGRTITNTETLEVHVVNNP